MPTYTDTAPGPDLRPMFQQPTLGLLLLALDEFGMRWGGWRRLRIPCRMLICRIVEEGGSELTPDELVLIRFAVKRYLRTRPERAKWLEAFLD